MLKRLLKIVTLGCGLLIVIAIVGAAVLYAALVRTTNVQDYASYSEIPLNSWAKIDLSDQAVCSDGSEYNVYTRRGTSDNLLVHFAGGGACWDGETCSRPITISDFSGYYFPYFWEIARATADGIFKTDNPNNPFADWNEVYIPYCTADFHAGMVTQSFPLENNQSVTIHYNGRQNVTEALDWVYDTFPQPEKLMISGDSAGGFGSILWTPTIAEHYPTSSIYQLADGVFLQTPKWPEIMNQVWEADTAQNFGFEVMDDIAGDAYVAYSQTSPSNITYLHINTLFDGTLLYFNAKLNDISSDSAYRASWSQAMRTSMARIADSGLNYAYYLTDYGIDPETGLTPHTSISNPLFYQIEEDDVYLSDWLRRIVNDGEHFSVGSAFLSGE